MLAVLTLVFVIAISMFVTKAATIALIHTGMSRDRAQFQARSAFSGAGFTTSESEVVVRHPVRRRIIMLLILLGNAGVVTAVASLILGFTNDRASGELMWNAGLLLMGITLLLVATKSVRIGRLLEKSIIWYLDKHTDIRTKNFAKMMTVMEDFEIVELTVEKLNWLIGSSLAKLKLTNEGVLILGIVQGDDTYIGIPRGTYVIDADDKLIVYGRGDRIASLSKRVDKLEGKAEHKESVEAFQEEMQEQEDGGDLG